MAIVVDKVKKRQSLALACKDLILNEDINSLSISKITSYIGIGKGSFYEYFKNKDDLVFELARILMSEYNTLLEIKLAQAKSKDEKLRLFASFFYDKKYKDLRKLYNKFLAIALVNSNKEMQNFQLECFNLYSNWLESIILEDEKDESKKVYAKQLAKMLISSVKGIYITCVSTGNSQNIKSEIDKFLDFINSIGGRGWKDYLF